MTLGKSMGLAAALLTGLAAFAVAPAARAADLGGGYKEVERGHGYSLWNGYYGGLNVGYGQKKTHADWETAGVPVIPVFPSTLSVATDGVVLGGQVGRNWLHGQFVYGVEFDMNYTNGSTQFPGGIPSSPERWQADRSGVFVQGSMKFN